MNILLPMFVHDISIYYKFLQYLDLNKSLNPISLKFWQALNISFFKFIKYLEFDIIYIVLFVIKVERKSNYINIYDFGDDKNFIRPLSLIFIHFANFKYFILFVIF